MAKATLTYKLPEEQSDFNFAVHGSAWALAMWDLDQALRGWLKYGHELKDADTALEAARSKLREVCEEHGVDLEDII